MTFKDFLHQPFDLNAFDQEFQEIFLFVKNIPKIPSTYDPTVLSKFIFNKLDRKQTIAFKRVLSFYFTVSNHPLAHSQKAKNALELIGKLQLQEERKIAKKKKKLG